MKECSVCKVSKPLGEYYNSMSSKDGKGYRCKVCDSSARKKYYEENEKSLEKRTERGRRSKYKKYGITSEEYQVMLDKQGGCCAVCGGEETRSASHEMSVDHDHITGKVRGLLCNNCNRGIGLLGDTEEALHKAWTYLRPGGIV